MADLNYIDSNYFTPDQGYYTYTADADSAITTVATINCIAGILLDTSATISTEVTQATNITRIKDFNITILTAFTPTLIVEALKNTFAILDVTVALSSTVVATRATSVLLEHIADLNAMAAKTVDTNSTISATVTISAVSSKSVVSSATLNTTATLSIFPAFNVQFGTATLNSSSSMFVSRLFGTGRPRIYTQVGTPTLSTTIKKFGAASLMATPSSYIYTPHTTDWNNWATVDLWFNLDQQSSGGFVPLVSRGNWEIAVLPHQPGKFQIYVDVNDTGGWQSTIITGLSATWVHLRVLRQATFPYFRVSVNGIELSSSVNYLTTSVLSGTGNLLIGHNAVAWTGTNTEVYIDELLITDEILPASFTPPTSAWAPSDQSQIQLLSHYNINYTDDVSITQSASATLSSTTSIIATADASIKEGLSNQIVNATLTANAGRLSEGIANLTVTATQSIVAYRIQNAISDQQAITSISTIIGSIKQFDSIQYSLFAPSIICQAQLAGIALLESNFNQVTEASKTTDTQSNSNSEFSIIINTTVTAGLASELLSSFTETVTAYKIQTALVDISTIATVSCEFTAFNNFSIDLVTNSSLTADIDHLVGMSSNETSEFTLGAINDRYRATSIALNNTSEIVATAYRIQSAIIDINSNVTMSIQGVKTPGIGIDLTSAFTITPSVSKTVSPIPVLDSIASQLSVVAKNATGTILMESSSSLSVIIGSIKSVIVGPNLGGINFNNGELVTIGDTLLTITEGNSPGTYPPSAEKFLIAFWANNPTGAMLTTFSDQNGSIEFGANTVTFWGALPNNQNDRRRTTWSGIDTSGWHHYMLYQTTAAPTTSSSSNLMLLVDGLPSVNFTVTIVNADGIPSAIDNIGLWASDELNYGPKLQWFVGITPDVYYDTVNNVTEVFDFGPNYTYSGQLHQLVAYWNSSVPSLANLNRIYDGRVPLDLGADGTATGLVAPDIYLRLNDYSDINSIGALTDIIVKWREVDNLDEVDSLLNHWRGTKAHATSIADNAPVYYPGISATTTLTSIVNSVIVTAIELQAINSLSVTAYKIVSNSAALSAVSTVIVNSNQIHGATISSVSTASITNTISKFTGYNANLISTATLYADGGFYNQVAADLYTVVELSIAGDIIPPTRATADLLTIVTMAIDPTSYSDAIIMQVGEFSLDAIITIKEPIRATADLTATVTLTVIIGSIEQFAVLVASSGTMLINASYTAGGQSNISSLATLATTAVKFTGIIAHLQVVGFQLIAGDIINIDPYLTLLIVAEDRGLIIEQEARVITVISETRVNNI